MTAPREQLAKRLSAAGLLKDRLIPVETGGKASLVNHNDREQRESNFVNIEGNYGVYAGANRDGDRWLIDVDVDDYNDATDDEGLAAVNGLPDTLTVASPHTDGDTGGHRYYYIDAEDVASKIESEAGARNPIPTFGEIRVQNQYVVGPGSQLDSCTKEWCNACKTPEGGNYEIAADREIAQITLTDLLDVLDADGYITEDEQNKTNTAKPEAVDLEDEELLKKAKNASNGKKFKRLWNGNTSGYKSHSEADLALCDSLAFWTGGDRQRIDKLFRKSGMYREKWDREDYRDRTISKALQDRTEFYSPQLDDDGAETGLYDNQHAVKSAIKMANGIAESLGTDEEPSDRQVKTLRTIAAKLPKSEYKDHCEEIADTIGANVTKLDKHRQLYKYRDQYGKIRVRDGGTYYLMDTDGGLVENQVLNFELDVQSILKIQGEQYVQADLNKEFGGTTTAQFAPKVLKRKQRFKDKVLGESFGLNYDPPYQHSEDVLNALNEYIGLLDVPIKEGTHHIGVHENEWVTPKGALGENGWIDEPSTVFAERNVALERVSSLPKDAEYDTDDVTTILKNIAKTRDTDRLLPVLGWFYAAPFRPYIVDEWNASGMNHLNVTGDTGSGKTTTLKYLWRCFGAGPKADPFDVTDTNFAMLSTMATSNGFPVWYDEFKPADIQDYKLDKFQELYRKASTGGVATRGKADQTTEEYHLKAPLVLSGEEQIRSPAERRRSIMVSFREDVTNKGTDTRKEFKELVGEGRIENGELVLPNNVPNPTHHATAYYRWVAGQNQDELRSMWEEARESVWRLRQSWDTDLDEANDMEIQALQTVTFGWMVMRAFAESNGVSPQELPSQNELDEALQHVVSEIGPQGQRKSHMDRFIELYARAAANDYLEEGTHYAVVYEGKAGQEEIRIHVSRSYEIISKYVRDHDLTSMDLLSNPDDYRKRFREAAETDGGYVTTTGQYTPQVSGNCTGINTIIAMNELEFDRATFELEPMEDKTESESDGDSDGGGNGQGPPADADGPLANAQRLTAFVRQNEPTTKEKAAVELVTGGQMNSESFDPALQKARKKGLIEIDGDDLRALS